MELLASQLAEATGGRLFGPDRAFDGASFDSRSIEPGQLFVPIAAERDGHDFIASAVSAGCRLYLTQYEPVGLSPESSAVVVVDTAAALMALAGWVRRRLDIPVVGITGSVGKTSTKDLTAAALGATTRVHANVSSFNNEQGLPVTMLGAPVDTEVLVVEMGMRGFGEITRLCEVADPTIGVVTAVASSHTERVGGIDGVALAKAELIEWLPADGTAVLNADDERVARMADRTDATVVTVGRDGDVRVSDIVLDELARPRFTIETPWGSGDVHLAVSGIHMVSNAAAALAVAGVVTGGIDAALAGLSTAEVAAMRMQIGRTSTGAVVVNDAYNANPDSMRAALEAVAAMSARRRVAVLGPMAELDDAPAGHRQVADDAARLGIDVIAVGTDLYGADRIADQIGDAVGVLGPVELGDVVLVKASRSAGLDVVARQLLDT